MRSGAGELEHDFITDWQQAASQTLTVTFFVPFSIMLQVLCHKQVDNPLEQRSVTDCSLRVLKAEIVKD